MLHHWRNKRLKTAMETVGKKMVFFSVALSYSRGMFKKKNNDCTIRDKNSEMLLQKGPVVTAIVSLKPNPCTADLFIHRCNHQSDQSDRPQQSCWNI